MSNQHDPILIDETEASKRLGLSLSFLRKDRRGKRLIPFVKLGKTIRYAPAALTAAMQSLSRGGAAK